MSEIRDPSPREEAVEETPEVERRLRASLEKFGQHEPLCPAALNAPLTARCTCGYHAALNWFPARPSSPTPEETP